MQISIHAPTRERQSHPDSNGLFQIISIHAPTRERQGKFVLLYRFNYISIHAPTRERPGRLVQTHNLAKFQSTPPHGSDAIRQQMAKIQDAISIHAPTRERHRSKISVYYPDNNFNPRPHTGATAILHDLITNCLIFIRQFIQHHFCNKPVFSNLLKTVPNSPYIQVRISLRIYVYLTFALDIFTILPPLPIDNTIINIPLLALSL